MNIGPRNKISQARKHRRHSTWKTINLKKLTNKSNMLAHRVCPVCGYYNGKQVVTIKTKSKNDVIDA